MQGTRRRLLDATARTLRQTGATGLTLDAVAREAGVSKGGLLHHFRSKDALVEALLRDLLTAFDEHVRQLAEAEPAGPARLLRAYVRASFDVDDVPLDLSAVLLGAIVGNETLLGLVRADADRWRDRLLGDGVPRARVLLVQMAADAAWLERLLEAGDTDPADRTVVEAELLRLTEASTW
jgi:AcrR family transcriptional regulator